MPTILSVCCSKASPAFLASDPHALQLNAPFPKECRVSPNNLLLQTGTVHSNDYRAPLWDATVREE